MSRFGRLVLVVVELAILTALVLATRCANYQDVFVAGNVYFVDADCYARMTRVQLITAKPGLILRHHDFENFPQGTTPHTTAPLDYLILGLSLLLNPFTTHAIDFAGAFVSPLLALIGGWFLWWWSRLQKFRYRWVTLILYGISPILVHGTELGRPDHQSLSIVLVAIAICAQWSSQANAANPPSPSSGAASMAASTRHVTWSVVSGIAWGLAIWVSAYESLILFVLVLVLLFACHAVAQQRRVLRNNAPHSGAATAKSCRGAWLPFVLIIALAVLVERRAPSVSVFYSDAIFTNWARTIGELAHVSPANPIWLRWCGYFLLITPFLLWFRVTNERRVTIGGRALPIYVLLIATYVLTIWQARWGYFFALFFALALAPLLEPIKPRAAVWIAFVLSLYPILRDWDERFWPNEAQLASRIERRSESLQIRDLALDLRSSDVRPFLAPWWLSPSIAYWSRQPGVAGSSHEGLKGIQDSARFFLSEDPQRARGILQTHRAAWIFSYDSERVARNSAAILNERIPARPLCDVVDRTPSQAPPFLIFSEQNAACKVYRVVFEQ